MDYELSLIILAKSGEEYMYKVKPEVGVLVDGIKQNDSHNVGFDNYAKIKNIKYPNYIEMPQEKAVYLASLGECVLYKFYGTIIIFFPDVMDKKQCEWFIDNILKFDGLDINMCDKNKINKETKNIEYNNITPKYSTFKEMSIFMINTCEEKIKNNNLSNEHIHRK